MTHLSARAFFYLGQSLLRLGLLGLVLFGLGAASAELLDTEDEPTVQMAPVRLPGHL
jgi:hypothetical protein